jgi:hypothetical protein
VGLAVLMFTGTQALAGGIDPVLTISTTTPGSMVVFPKVVADGTRDTIISLTNVSNMMVYAHCEYTNGNGRCAGSPAGQIHFCNQPGDCLNVVAPDDSVLPDVGPCEVTWQTANFDVALTGQQPTFWRVSTGRTLDPTLVNVNPVACTQGGIQRCPGFFFGLDTDDPDPNPPSAVGTVPPPAFNNEFRGELRCAQIMLPSEELTAGNSFKGEALIENLNGSGFSVYNSINIEAGTISAPDRTAVLNGIEYAACPEGIGVSHLASGVDDPAAASINPACDTGDCFVRAEITFTPCSAHYEAERPVEFSPELVTWNEQEQPLSLSRSYLCWANLSTEDPLTANFAAPVQGFAFMRTTLEESEASQVSGAVGGMCDAGDSYGMPCDDDSECDGANCGPASAILGVVESFYNSPASMGGGPSPGTSAESALMLSMDTSDDDDDLNEIARSGRDAAGNACPVVLGSNPGCDFDRVVFTP